MVARQLFKQYYSGNFVVDARQGISTNPMLKTDVNSVYFCISKNLILTNAEVQTIFNSVYAGNTFFLSATRFDAALLNTVFATVAEAVDTSTFQKNYAETRVSLIHDLVNGDDSVFSYYYRSFNHYFLAGNSNNGRSVGYNGDGNTNCMVFFWGKGKLFLHSEPRAFSNYFLLTNNNYRYLENILRVLGDSPQHVFWDDYYRLLNSKPGSNSDGNAIGGILKQPPLAWAFFLLIGLFAFYLIFNGKRKQRQIKIVPPNINSAVAFSETIARLYMQEGDHKAIALKMAAHFQEFIRTNYYLTANISHPEMVSTLSRKSGVSEESTKMLLDALDKLALAKVVTDKELLVLHNQIQEFYKKRS